MFLLVAFNAIIPLMAVVNYSVQDILGGAARFVGLEMYRDALRNSEFQWAFLRQLFFSLMALLVQIPLGIGVALVMPKKGPAASLTLVLIAIPLLIPWNVVGVIWQLFARTDIGLGGVILKGIGFDYNHTLDGFDAWATVLLMDVWHWTPLVALMCFAGLRAIPDAYYQAARIDGARPLAVFRYIQLPRLKSVLVIAVLLRFMDSFMIYTEPKILTGGGPGNSTTFLSQFLVNFGVDPGPAAAFSIIYFLFILLFCYIFYSIMMSESESGQNDPSGNQ